jgi:hypothetical protein
MQRRSRHPQPDMIQHLEDLAELKDQGTPTKMGNDSSGPGYLASRPISCTRWTAWLREATPSLR